MSAKKDNILNLNPYLYANKGLKDANEYLLQIRKKLAKRANQRARRLSESGIDYGAIKQYKADVARYYSGKKGFPENLKLTKGITLEHEIALLQDFLKRPSSTPGGIAKIRKKAMKTIESKYDVRFRDVGQYEEYVESETFKKLSLLYDSKTAMKITGISDSSIDDLNEFFQKTDKYTASEVAKQLGFKNLPDMQKKLRK